MKYLKLVDKYIESVIIFICYFSMAGIIFIEVIKRYVFQVQSPWSTTIPIYLFLWVTWLGASYNVRNRTHLKFDEVRIKLPYNIQFCCQILDVICWYIFSIVVVYYTWEQVTLSRDNFQFVDGTNNVMQWWFYLATPFAWSLIIVRATQNFFDDINNFRQKKPFSIRASLNNDQD